MHNFSIEKLEIWVKVFNWKKLGGGFSIEKLEKIEWESPIEKNWEGVSIEKLKNWKKKWSKTLLLERIGGGDLFTF